MAVAETRQQRIKFKAMIVLRVSVHFSLAGGSWVLVVIASAVDGANGALKAERVRMPHSRQNQRRPRLPIAPHRALSHSSVKAKAV